MKYQNIHEHEQFLLCYLFLYLKLLELLKQLLLFLIELSYLFPSRTGTFINGKLFYLIINLKNHQIELFQITEFQTTLYQLTYYFEMHFLAQFFVFLSTTINEVNCFHQKFSVILKVTPVYFLTADFSLFSCEPDSFTFTLLYSTIYIFTKLLLLFCKIPILFILIFQEQCIVLIFLHQLFETLIVELLLDQHLKFFVYLNQL